MRRTKAIFYLIISLALLGIAPARADDRLNELWALLTTQPAKLTQAQWEQLESYGPAIDPLMTAYVDQDIEAMPPREEELMNWLFDRLRREHPIPPFIVAALERQADRTDWVHEPPYWFVNLMSWMENPHIVPIAIQRVRQKIPAWRPFNSAPIQSKEEQRQRFFGSRNIRWALWKVIDFGPLAAELGPDLEALLHKPVRADLRAALVQALGQLEYKPALPVLKEQIPYMQHDFAVAYYLIETLARLDKDAHLDLFRQTARSYWYAPVRQQAKRALLYRPGQPFRLNPVPDEFRQGYYLNVASRALEYDMELGDVVCSIEWTMKYPQLEDGVHDVAYGWPPVDGFPLWLEPQKPSEDQKAAITASLPDYFQRYYGDAEFVARIGGWDVVGLNHGEFGGGVVARPVGAGSETQPIVLWDENANMVVYTDERLFVLTGLSHLRLSYGSLLIIEPGEGAPVVTAAIRLPREAHSLALMGPNKLFLQFENTDMIVRADGTVLDARRIDACAGPPKEWLKDMGEE